MTKKYCCIMLIAFFLIGSLLSQDTKNYNMYVLDEDSTIIGRYFDIKANNISVSVGKNNNFELLPNVPITTNKYTTILEKIKRETHNDGRFENTQMQLWDSLPIPIYVPSYSVLHYGVNINLKEIILQTIDVFQQNINSCLPENRSLNLFKTSETKLASGDYGINVGFPNSITWTGINEWDMNNGGIPMQAELNLRSYIAADSLGNPAKNDFEIEIRRGLYSLLVDCDGNAPVFWDRIVKFFRTQSTDSMNEDIVEDLTDDEYNVLAILYGLHDNNRDLSLDMNEINNSPFAIAINDLSSPTNAVINLDGSGSFDPDGDILTYSWQQTGGPQIPISHANAPTSQVTLQRFGNYTFLLTVTDSHGAFATDMVQVYGYSAAPVPNPVTTINNSIIATYYIPLWGRKNTWPPGRNSGVLVEDFTLGTPIYHNLLGNYDTADTLVSNWHIKMALENGINTFLIPNSYPSSHWSPEKNFEDGLMKSRYFNMIKFAMLFNMEPWWNSQYLNDIISLDDLIVETVNYYIDNYFKLPNYLLINNKPVLVIYHMWIHESQFGVENSVKVLSRIREVAAQRGVELYLIGDVMSPVHHNYYTDVQMINACDAVSSYAMWCTPYYWQFRNETVYTQFSYRDHLQGYEEENAYYSALCNDLNKDFIPPATMGADTRDRFIIGINNSYVYHTGPSPELFGQSLEDLKKYIDNDVKMVIVYAWNEHHEANVLEPTYEYGYQYLEKVRNAFGIQPQNGWPVNIIP